MPKLEHCLICKEKTIKNFKIKHLKLSVRVNIFLIQKFCNNPFYVPTKTAEESLGHLVYKKYKKDSIIVLVTVASTLSTFLEFVIYFGVS